MSEDIGRRGFFREGLKAFARTLAETAHAANEFRGKASVDKKRRLRPPGAIAEDEFLEKCSGTECNACVEACPCDCIAKVPSGFNDEGTPVIIPSLRACAMCIEVSCTKVCDEGALLPIEDASEIDMGIAVLNQDVCFAFNGTFCVTCFNICPTQPKAIRLNERGRPEVVEDPCTGCGMCEERCPTSPRAIWIKSGRRNT